MIISELVKNIKDGYRINKEEALSLVDTNLDELAEAADELREYFCGNKFDVCSIINGKSGRCSEDCKYCAQSAHYKTEVETYPLLSTAEILEGATYNHERHVLRYAVVTSGRALSDSEVDQLADSLREVQSKCPIKLCVSGGLLNSDQYARLHDAGVERIHNNLEASAEFFPQICTTHTTEDKINSIKYAQSVGLKVCSGGIMGLGESMSDRIDMALLLRDLGVDSVPVNILNPIPGTPLGDNPKLNPDEVRRIVAIYRFILPDVFIRLAGGRGLLPDKGEACFTSGANAMITGDMLTTAGISIETDMQLIDKLGYSCTL